MMLTTQWKMKRKKQIMLKLWRCGIGQYFYVEGRGVVLFELFSSYFSGKFPSSTMPIG